MRLSKEFKDILIDNFVELHIKLYYPRCTRHRYAEGKNGIYERLEDEVKIEHLKEIMRLNNEWDIEEIGRETSERIRQKTSLY